jgi:hypothetical protein
MRVTAIDLVIGAVIVAGCLYVYFQCFPFDKE